jgi:hypothetical protein
MKHHCLFDFTNSKDDEENYLDRIMKGQHLLSADVISIAQLDINLKNTIFITAF